MRPPPCPQSGKRTREAPVGKTIVDISPSLDGYVAGEGVGVDAPFGTAGQRLTAWSMEDPDDVDKAAARVMFENTGAFVIGRTLFDVGIGLWGEDGTWGMPVYVVTHRPGPDLVKGPTRFSFVTGVEEALRRAHETAAGRDVVIAGGASVVQQALMRRRRRRIAAAYRARDGRRRHPLVRGRESRVPRSGERGRGRGRGSRDLSRRGARLVHRPGSGGLTRPC